VEVEILPHATTAENDDGRGPARMSFLNPDHDILGDVVRPIIGHNGVQEETFREAMREAAVWSEAPARLSLWPAIIARAVV
jgi:hypothetical protein